MRINNNLMAFNTHRQFTINNESVATTTEKLSSGFRINRAGDDAAGLAISEKMRAQIRGLEMASKNSQDAISLVQTAEGALTETHAILQKMRELAVQSASDTNDTEIVDRKALDAEFEQLMLEIDDIATKTKFNGKGILEGAEGGTGGIIRTDTSYAAQASATMDAGSSNVTGVTVSIDESTFNDWAKENNIGNVNFKATYNSSDSEYTIDIGGGKNIKGTIDGGGSAGNAATVTFGDTGLTLTFAVGPSDTIVNDELNDVTEIVITRTDTPIYEQIPKTSYDTNLVDGESETVADNIEVNWGGYDPLKEEVNLKADGDGFMLTIGNDKFKGGAIDEDGTITFKEANGSATIEMTFTNDGAAVDDLSEVTDIATNGVNIFTATTMDNTDGGSISDDPLSLTIQTGANEGDQLDIEIQAMSAGRLGLLNDVDAGKNVTDIASEARANVLDGEAARKAITTVNDAINKVSTQRSQLGAYQNRLEHKINNLNTSAENLQAAESRIRDLDMAKEMTAFTRNSILVQASTAMLAQANNAPQVVLSLLR